MTIEQALQQQTPFENIRSKTGVNLLFTASWYSTLLMRYLKPYGISWQQFNILRILKGQNGKPAPLRLVTERMIDQMSNTSRLIDKLVNKGLVARTVCPNDRRKVDLLITAAGLEIVETAFETIDLRMKKTFEHMTAEKLDALNALMDDLRGEL